MGHLRHKKSLKIRKITVGLKMYITLEVNVLSLMSDHFFQCPTLCLLGANMNQQYKDIKYGLNVENKLLLFFEVLSDLMYFQC